MRHLHLSLTLVAAVACAGPASAQQVFSNTTPISLPDAPTPASLYPSTITVSGLTRPVLSVTVRINGFAHANPDDVDMLLVSPTGRPFELWSDAGGTATQTAVDVTLRDDAANALPDGSGLATGSFRPADYNVLVTDTYPPPAPAGPYNPPAPTGSATLSSIFRGLSAAQANGVWSLYVVDDADNGEAGAITGGWALVIQQMPPLAPGDLIISEFRAIGPGGGQDEFVEIYNATGASFTVVARGGTGFGLANSAGQTLCTIPNNFVFPAHGRFLCVHGTAYSLASYPAGNGTTATGDAEYTTGSIASQGGIALFDNNLGGAGYNFSTRLDAVGHVGEPNPLYREGAGLPDGFSLTHQASWTRDECGKRGSTSTFGGCPEPRPRDTDDNAADFFHVVANAAEIGGNARQGAPSPQNRTSPLTLGFGIFPRVLFDECAALDAAPNYVRSATPVTNGALGTLELRRRFTNNTGGSESRLRYRIIDLSTQPVPSGVADLRALSSGQTLVVVDRPPCGTGTGAVTLNGTTLEQPPQQPAGGGFGSTLSVGVVTLATPLANGATIDLRFVFGVEQDGNFKVGMLLESLPGSGNLWVIQGSTQPGGIPMTEPDGGPPTASEPVITEDAASVLTPARPNPTTGQTQLDLIVARPQHVTAALYDALGRRLTVLLDGPVTALDPRAITVDGMALPPGVYFVRVRGEDFTASRPLTVAR